MTDDARKVDEHAVQNFFSKSLFFYLKKKKKWIEIEHQYIRNFYYLNIFLILLLFFIFLGNWKMCSTIFKFVHRSTWFFSYFSGDISPFMINFILVYFPRCYGEVSRMKVITHSLLETIIELWFKHCTYISIIDVSLHFINQL